MSDAGGGGARPTACQETVERMLDGLAVLGRAFRGAFQSVSGCVRRVSYPLKEFIVVKYDECAGRWTTHGTRTQRMRENVACFDAVEDSERDTSESSDTSTDS
ncbi:hypothetical protein, conserved [Eimeria tenella]|uniref:Uncharacterized protein n=1 Tax=Eimeria tenella TaxID=5802 RepID=U6KLT0_EIMTE|nr:hypothetical protein, conserved [Eimeria tenella]CDJ39057.1 hypothetical protein, conserved [Eimeria tenella]|eukprot:XP_013229812.1 hypothetical protein, conserved [Eimeria tenella]